MSTKPVGIGIVGAGVISEIYMQNLGSKFPGTYLVGVSDVIPARAEARAKQFNTTAMSNDELINHPDVELVVSLTPPGAGNLSEWAKKQDCWIAFKEVGVAGLPDFSSFTIDKSQATSVKKDSQKEAVIDHGIRAQVKVMEIAPEQWRMIRDWGNERGLASATDLGVLRVATSMPSKIPSEKQSKRLLDLISRFDEHGCPFVKGI